MATAPIISGWWFGNMEKYLTLFSRGCTRELPVNFWLVVWNMIFLTFHILINVNIEQFLQRSEVGRSMISNQHLVGVLEHEFYDFPYVGNSNPNWRTHIFQRGWSTTNQIIMVLDPHQQYYCSLVVDDCFSLGGLFASFRMVFHVVLLGVKLHFFIWSLKSGYTGYFLAKKCGQGKNKMHWVWCIRDHVESKWRPLSGCSLLHGKFIAPDPSLGNSIPTHAPIVLKCIKYPLVDWIYLYIYDQEGTYLSIITTNETPTHDICIDNNIIYLYIIYLKYIIYI